MSDHPRGRLVGWILLALAGLAVAVALSVTASNLSTQPIGLSGEPLRAGERLAPASVSKIATTQTAKQRAKKQTPTQTATATAPTQTATAPGSTTTSGSGSSGSGDSDNDRGRERERDSDDD